VFSFGEGTYGTDRLPGGPPGCTTHAERSKLLYTLQDAGVPYHISYHVESWSWVPLDVGLLKFCCYSYL
jgi:hypothetical protein